MSRTSRRKQDKPLKDVSVTVTRNNREPAAAYVRFSVEETEGDTVDTQLALLKDFIEQEEKLYLEDVYIDNGYSGTNFDRPEFNRMMADARSGKIKCIVVKDLSRFGRNFIESGYYIETLLPRLNVRLIAVTDDFDSSRQTDQDSISVPIKNMVNEFYAKDYSKKVSDMNKARRKSGNYTIERAVYGYSVDKEKNEYYVNPDTAPIVQLIFRWYLSGMSIGTIAQRLNLLGVMTPKEYKSLYETGEEMNCSRLWNHGKVKSILVRDFYVGDRCLGTRLTAMYKNAKNIEIPREEWTVYRNDHDALVTREDFAKVQQMLQEHEDAMRATKVRGKELSELDNIFTNLVYCGKCDRKMRIETKRYRDGAVKMEGAIYVCKGRIGADDKKGCRLSIELDLLRIVVNDQMQKMIDLMLDQEQIISKLRKNHSQKNPIQKYRTRLSSLAMKEEKCGEKIARIYEELALGLIKSEEFISLKNQYQNERNEYIEIIKEYQTKLARTQKYMDEFEEIVTTLKNRFQHVHLDREILEYMVERITVYEGGHIDIRFRFEDVFQAVTEIVEGSEYE